MVNVLSTVRQNARLNQEHVGKGCTPELPVFESFFVTIFTLMQRMDCFGPEG